MEHTEKWLCGKRHGQGGRELSRYVRTILLSVVLGEAVTMGMLFLFSLIICRVELPPLATDILVVLAAAAGAFAAGLACGKASREKGLLLGLVCGGALLAILLLLGVGFHQPSTLAFSCVKAAMILAGAVLGGMLGVNRACRKKRIKY